MKTVLKYLAIVMLAMCAHHASGQHEYQPRLAVKWSALHMIYFYPSVQLAVEHRLWRNLSIQYDAGIIVNYPDNNSENYSHKRGYRFTGELRYYIPSPPKVPMYIAAEGHRAEARFDRTGVVGYNCDNGCSYYEYKKYTVRNINEGFGVKFGVMLYPGWNRNRKFFFDLNLGFAPRWITYDKSPLSGSGTTVFDDDLPMFSPNEETRQEVRPVAGIRLGFRIL